MRSKPDAIDLHWPGQIVRTWHLTSLDAPTVAVVWASAFAWAARVRLPLWLPAGLAFAAWSLYIGDRLLDARNARTPLRERHHFHWKHRRIFFPAAIAAGAAALMLAMFSMPVDARERNSLLAVAALAYFTRVHSPWRVPAPGIAFRVPKELLVGILFTVACLAPTWARVPGDRWDLVTPALAFTGLAWLNCHAIECWESQVKRKVAIFRLAAGLAIVALLGATAVAYQFPRQASLLASAAVSAALLAFLDRQRHKLTPVTLRAAADLVLLAPALLLFFQ